MTGSVVNGAVAAATAGIGAASPSSASFATASRVKRPFQLGVLGASSVLFADADLLGAKALSVVLATSIVSISACNLRIFSILLRRVSRRSACSLL